MAVFETFDNLPNVAPDLQDGGIVFPVTSNLPVIMVLGTASQGTSDTVYSLRGKDPNLAKGVFGLDGTVVRGMYEVAANAGDATDAIKLYRIGAKSASLAGVGNSSSQAGYTIETDEKDRTVASGIYLLYEPILNDRLRVFTSPDSGATFDVVYDNKPDDPAQGVTETYDLGVVFVTGTAGSGVKIGTSVTAPQLMSEVSVAGVTLTNGNDGLSLSRMETYEALYNAYLNLENEDMDCVVPMNVYLDDKNLQDLTTAEITSKGLDTLTAYPTAGGTKDYLGKLFVQDFNGKAYFWWDTDRDGIAEIYPSVGSASSAHDVNGKTLTAADFHEVNFAYQLANFCFDSTENNVAMTGVIGVLPPTGAAGTQLNQWVGTLPTVTTNTAGDIVITKNGTGLLGNKFMSGRLGNGSTGLPSHTVKSVAGLADGGFIATKNGYLDGTQKKDANDHLVDIGKYLSVVATYPALSNSWRSTAYIASGAATYAGFFANLDAQSAPTNKVISVSGLPYVLNNLRLNDLTGQRYVTFRTKTKGNVVTDAPTAARPDSDYQRLTTFRIVKTVLDAVREEADPFIGEAGTASARAALETALERRLNDLKSLGLLKRHAVSVTATPQQEFQGDATVSLELVPAFELRQITVITSLAAL